MSTTNIDVYGFDSFVGLPNQWSIGPGFVVSKGAYTTRGNTPAWEGMPENVRFIQGWFNESLPPFLDRNPHVYPALLLIDCDLYSSTKDALVPLAERGLLKKGLLIRFDEYWNFRHEGGPDTQHESKAWEEVAEEFGIDFTPLFWYDQSLTIIVDGTQ